MNFKRCILLLIFLFTFLFFNFGCFGFETPSELQAPEPTTEEKAAITGINNLPDEISSIRRTDLVSILNEADLMDYFKSVGGENFSLFIKSIGGKKEVERYIKLFKNKDEFKKFVTNHSDFKSFMILFKTSKFNEEFTKTIGKTFDQALKDNSISVS